jgi:dynein heavy chain
VHFTENYEITKLISMEREEVPLIEHIDVNEGDRKGNVEIWMTDLEKSMFATLKEKTKQAVENYTQVARTEWVKSWPGQIILCVSQIFWTK